MLATTGAADAARRAALRDGSGALTMKKKRSTTRSSRRAAAFVNKRAVKPPIFSAPPPTVRMLRLAGADAPPLGGPGPGGAGPAASPRAFGEPPVGYLPSLFVQQMDGQRWQLPLRALAVLHHLTHAQRQAEAGTAFSLATRPPRCAEGVSPLIMSSAQKTTDAHDMNRPNGRLRHQISLLCAPHPIGAS